jgi:hypothetical protein
MADKKHDVLLEELFAKVQQHEKTIAQLVEIIGATNCRISELASKQSKEKRAYLPS